MTALTRRRDPEAHEETRRVFYGDVHVGSISMRTGIPIDKDPWGWTCGFYPGSDPGEYLTGTAPNFDQARADFSKAWQVFSARRTEADFTAYRQQHAFTAWKYEMQETGCKMPTQMPGMRSRCFCGADIGVPCEEHAYASHMEAA